MTPLRFDTTGDSGRGVANAVSLDHGNTGLTGDVATVTASTAGQTATASVTFAGDADNCVIMPADGNVGAGGSVAVTVNFWSDTDQTVPVPDYSTIMGTGTGTGDPTITAVNSAGRRYVRGHGSDRPSWRLDGRHGDCRCLGWYRRARYDGRHCGHL